MSRDDNSQQQFEQHQEQEWNEKNRFLLNEINFIIKTKIKTAQTDNCKRIAPPSGAYS